VLSASNANPSVVSEPIVYSTFATYAPALLYTTTLYFIPLGKILSTCVAAVIPLTAEAIIVALRNVAGASGFKLATILYLLLNEVDVDCSNSKVVMDAVSADARSIDCPS